MNQTANHTRHLAGMTVQALPYLRIVAGVQPEFVCGAQPAPSSGQLAVLQHPKVAGLTTKPYIELLPGLDPSNRESAQPDMRIPRIIHQHYNKGIHAFRQAYAKAATPYRQWVESCKVSLRSLESDNLLSSCDRHAANCYCWQQKLRNNTQCSCMWRCHMQMRIEKQPQPMTCSYTACYYGASAASSNGAMCGGHSATAHCYPVTVRVHSTSAPPALTSSQVLVPHGMPAGRCHPLFGHLKDNAADWSWLYWHLSLLSFYTCVCDMAVIGRSIILAGRTYCGMRTARKP